MNIRIFPIVASALVDDAQALCHPARQARPGANAARVSLARTGLLSSKTHCLADGRRSSTPWSLVSRHRSSVGPRWPSKRSLRHLIRDATLAGLAQALRCYGPAAACSAIPGNTQEHQGGSTMSAMQWVKTAQEGGVLVIRLNSPENRNSLTSALREQLGAAVDRAAQDRSVRALYLTGEGPSFCAGGDFRMLQTHSDPWPVHRRFRDLVRWFTPLMALDKPVVVGVRGHAVGGGMGLALTGDVVIAGTSAQFMSGFFRLGTIPDIGVMYQLPRLIGMARAKNFLFGGATMRAKEALELGLVARVVPDEQLDAAGLQEAARLAAGPAEVMGLAKTLMARSFETTLHDMLAFEGLGQALAMSHPEFREGLAAAIAGRPADFAGAAAHPVRQQTPGGQDRPIS
ncbi:enoyl-CoA hydratase/isomerase family protein [Verminephrobacter eiseniae]|uniref:enoyl-CoA hydratase/isomerase family protein n=2 Tax=Verminephrobacter eiseniae TaxID=364317 RepID=UPI0022438D30|nr:enoyl-CoA hydratase/isomerase family protein [Verminephrobacter eiseniae]